MGKHVYLSCSLRCCCCYLILSSLYWDWSVFLRHKKWEESFCFYSITTRAALGTAIPSTDLCTPLASPISLPVATIASLRVCVPCIYSLTWLPYLSSCSSIEDQARFTFSRMEKTPPKQKGPDDNQRNSLIKRKYRGEEKNTFACHFVWPGLDW